jgi:hypothetical protein
MCSFLIMPSVVMSTQRSSTSEVRTGWPVTKDWFAARPVTDPTLVARLYDVLMALDKRFQPDDQTGVLRDYGDQSNLLEMRSAGWEHVVASPNADRAWALEALAELSDLTGAALPAADLRESAQLIRAEIVRQLWDDGAGWFPSRYPDGHTELAYSIQAFDVLRTGACPPHVTKALLGHLGTFLGEYGVSSVSTADEFHYETADIDWSGAGAYTGEGPQLAQALWDRGEPELAWDVLRRLLWMGDHYPYFPQDDYSDKPGAPASGRRITSSRASPAPRPSSPAWQASARTPMAPSPSGPTQLPQAPSICTA